MENNKNSGEDELSKLTGEHANNRGVEGNLPGNDRSLTSNESSNRGTASTDKQQRKDIAEEAGLNRKDMSDIEDLGGLSGRDDYAGGSDVDMSNVDNDDIRNK